MRFNPDLAKRLMIEITETAAMRDIEESARFIAQMRELGVRVALDDFGAGFTSFRHLKALAVDVVKIDSSFVAGVADNIDSQLFIKSLTAVAHGLGLQSVAEGVATAEDEAFLRGQGVSYFQGNRYGAPTATPDWMAARAS
jgi:EAL domain-containing protein (putative c-di-GMP-specific phosphodiesterase class I)